MIGVRESVIADSSTRLKQLADRCICGDIRRDHFGAGKRCMVRGCGCAQFVTPEAVAPRQAFRAEGGNPVTRFVDAKPEIVLLAIALVIACVAFAGLLFLVRGGAL